MQLLIENNYFPCNISNSVTLFVKNRLKLLIFDGFLFIPSKILCYTKLSINVANDSTKYCFEVFYPHVDWIVTIPQLSNRSSVTSVIPKKPNTFTKSKRTKFCTLQSDQLMRVFTQLQHSPLCNCVYYTRQIDVPLKVYFPQDMHVHLYDWPLYRFHFMTHSLAF